MRTLSVLLVACLAVGLLAGCEEPRIEVRPPPVAPPAAAVISLEVETFKLDQAEVKDLAGASGGRAVLFDSELSGAETSLPLKKGTYQVTLYMQGGDEDHDAVYLSVAGIEHRLWPAERDQVVAAEPFTVQVPTDGECKVMLLAAETGVYLDRVELRPVE